MNHTAAILAGGLGKRLRSVVSDRPKVMAEVNGRPFLSFLLDNLIAWGVEIVVLCTGYRGDFIREFYNDKYKSVSLLYSQEDAPLGTGGALRHALPFLDSEQIWVLNGDCYCALNAEAMWRQHQRQEALATIALRRVDDTSRYGEVSFDDDGMILQFDEKRGEPRGGWINGGIYLIKRTAIQSLPSEKPLSLEREVFPAWVGKRLFAFQQTSGVFLDIGTPESYRKASVLQGSREEDDLLCQKRV